MDPTTGQPANTAVPAAAAQSPPAMPSPSSSSPGEPPPTTVGPSTVPPKKRRRRRGVIGFVIDKAIPLLIAVLGLATALATTWGALAQADANDLEDSNTTLEDDKAELAARIEQLEDDVAQLTEERDQLQEEAADATSATTTLDDSSGPPVTTSGSARNATVRRQTGTTPLTFSSGYSIDLDTDALDWGVRDSSGAGLYFYVSRGEPRLYTNEISVVDHVPAKSECENATVLQPSLPSGETRVGLQICARTNDGRLAYVHIVQIDLDAATITLDLIVWD